jgi:hypothetical protein
MLEQAVFNEIKNDSVIAAKLVNGSVYHIYPLRVPDDIEFVKAVIYTEITQTLIYPAARTSLVQISCLAETFDDAVDLASDIDRIFNDKAEWNMGSNLAVKYSKFNGRNSYYDPDSRKFIVAVEIKIKF